VLPDSRIFTASGRLYCAESRSASGGGEVNWMATLSLEETEVSMATDDFSALEERVMRAVELVKKERAARSEAEQNSSRLQSQLDAQSALLEQTQEQLRGMEQDREHVRQRVERLLKQLDEIAA
jgi:chromosome segregation ATPase